MHGISSPTLVALATGCQRAQSLAAITASGESISKRGIVLLPKKAANGMQ